MTKHDHDNDSQATTEVLDDLDVTDAQGWLNIKGGVPKVDDHR